MGLVLYRPTPSLRSIQALALEVVLFCVIGLFVGATFNPWLARVVASVTGRNLVFMVFGAALFASYQILVPPRLGATPVRRLFGVSLESSNGSPVTRGQMARRLCMQLGEGALLMIGGPFTMIGLLVYRRRRGGWPHEVWAGTRTVWRSLGSG